jgi:ParB-like chromosome segregation protein Spo0J
MMSTEQTPPANVAAGPEAKDVVLVPAGTQAQEPAPLTRQSTATMKRIRIRLDQIVTEPLRFSHRNRFAFQEAALKPLMDSLVLEGLQVPIEGYRDSQGRFVVTKGHRRIASLRLLAGKNTPGFTADMEVEAIEVENCSPQELLVRSVADNAARQNYSRVERIVAAKRMYDAGVEEVRAAGALCISAKTFQRDLLIAKHGWMFQHLMDDSIDATAAFDLLDAAEKANRIDLVKEDLDAWIAERKRRIREKGKRYKLQTGKDLSPTEKLVRRQMPRHLVDHWVELIQQEKRFDDEAEWEYGAHLDREKRQLKIDAVTLDLAKDPPQKLAKVGAKLSRLSKQLQPITKQRMEEDAGVESDDESVYDEEYLRTVGAFDLIGNPEPQPEIVAVELMESEEAPSDPGEGEETAEPTQEAGSAEVNLEHVEGMKKAKEKLLTSKRSHVPKPERAEEESGPAEKPASAEAESATE